MGLFDEYTETASPEGRGLFDDYWDEEEEESWFTKLLKSLGIPEVKLKEKPPLVEAVMDLFTETLKPKPEPIPEFAGIQPAEALTTRVAPPIVPGLFESTLRAPTEEELTTGLFAPSQFKEAPPEVAPKPLFEDINKKIQGELAKRGEDPVINGIKDVLGFFYNIPGFIGSIGPSAMDVLAQTRTPLETTEAIVEPSEKMVEETIVEPLKDLAWLTYYQVNPLEFKGEKEKYEEKMEKLQKSPASPVLAAIIAKGGFNQLKGIPKTAFANKLKQTTDYLKARVKSTEVPETLFPKAPEPAGVPEVTLEKLLGTEKVPEEGVRIPGLEEPAIGEKELKVKKLLERKHKQAIKDLRDEYFRLRHESKFDEANAIRQKYPEVDQAIKDYYAKQEKENINKLLEAKGVAEILGEVKKGKEKPPPAVAGKAPSTREPWEMTARDFGSNSAYLEYLAKQPPETIKSRQFRDAMIYKGQGRYDTNIQTADIIARGDHKLAVQQALSEGKPVPEAVLAEYPELAKVKSAPGIAGKEIEEFRLTPPEIPPTEKIAKSTVEGEKPDIIGLNKAEQNRIRTALGLDQLEPAERKTWERTLSEAKESKVDESALTIADEVIKSQRPITDTEHAGMVLKAAKLADEYDASMRTVGEHIQSGDLTAANIERGRMDVLIDQLDKLTEGARLGRRETARALSIGRMMVNRESYDLAHVVQRARATKQAKLSPGEQAKLEELTSTNKRLETELKDVETRYEQLLAEKEKAIAEKVAKREARRVQIRTQSTEARVQIRADRENIKKQLTEMGFRVNDISGVTAEGAYLVGKLATTYIREGVATLNEVVQKVLVDLPELTENDVYRSLAAKNPKAQAKARSEVTQRISRLKKQADLLTKIEDAERGIFDPKRAKSVQLEEIRSLQKKLRDLRTKAYQSDIESARLEKALRKINELQDQLDNQYRAVRKGQKIDSPEMASAKEKMNEIRSAMRVEDELARLQDQLRTGEFEVKERVQPKDLPPEFERTKIELERVRRQIRTAIDDMAPMTARKLGVEAINTLRTMKATADMSGTLRQGLVASFRLARTDPIRLMQIYGKGIKSFFSQHTADQIDYGIRSADHHYLREKAGLQLTEMGSKLMRREEMFGGRLIEKFPVLGEIVKASNRHMTSILNMLRTECFDQFLKKYPNATQAELKAWADFVNVASGRGNLGRFSAIANELSLVIFAPRFSVSRIQTPYMFFKYLKEPRVRAEIGKDLATTATLGTAALVLAGLAGAEVGVNPREPDFGKIRIGDTRIDLWAGFQQPIRLVSRIGLAATDRIGLTGKDLMAKEKTVDPLDLLGRFSSYKLAPSVTIPRELITGKTAVGEPASPLETGARAFVPLIYEDIYDAYKTEGIGRAAVVGGLTFFGVGAQTYKNSESATRRAIRYRLKAGNEAGAYQAWMQWNIENPDNKISYDWYVKQCRELR